MKRTPEPKTTLCGECGHNHCHCEDGSPLPCCNCASLYDEHIERFDAMHFDLAGGLIR